MPTIRFYAVAIGAQPGIYPTWEGTGGAKEQVDHWPHARHKAFRTHEEALAFIKTELFDKLQGMRLESQSATEADGTVAGPSIPIASLTPNQVARLAARDKYLRSMQPDTRESEDVIMGEEPAVKTEE